MNSQEPVIFVLFVGPCGLKLNRYKIQISFEFWEIVIHVFWQKKTKEHMKSELSSIFWVKLAAKNDFSVPVDSFYVYVGYSDIHLNETL